MDSMAASISSSINLLERPACIVAPANEYQCALGLVAQLFALRAPRSGKGLAQHEPAQEHGAGEVSQCVLWVPTRTWGTTLLNQRSVILL